MAASVAQVEITVGWGEDTTCAGCCCPLPPRRGPTATAGHHALTARPGTPPDPRTTRRYDRARYSLDRAPGYALAGYLADLG
jgi:hypothetical protein